MPRRPETRTITAEDVAKATRIDEARDRTGDPAAADLVDSEPASNPLDRPPSTGDSPPRSVSAAMLIDAGACPDHVELFRATFGDGDMPVTAANLIAAADAKLDLDWFAARVLPPTARAEYDRAVDTARAEFDRADDAAWAEYKRAGAAAWAEYNRADDAAWAEYNRADDTALAEFRRAKARTLGTILADLTTTTEPRP